MLWQRGCEYSQAAGPAGYAGHVVAPEADEVPRATARRDLMGPIIARKFHQTQQGLAVSPDGRRALVVPGGARVLEVDLRTLAVAERELSEPVSLLGRLRSWLEPAALAKGRRGEERKRGARTLALTTSRTMPSAP